MKKLRLSYALVLLLLSNSLSAQLDVKNTGIVYISSATDSLYIPGAFTNAAGSAFTNNGVLQVKKDIVNDQASMSAGTGKLILDGTTIQTVGGSQTFNTFNLVTNNSAGFILNNNLSVSGIHTFTAGMITTSSTPNYMVYEAGSSYTGSSDARHVNGWVKKNGNTNFTFPVGTATYERPIALTNLTASGEFNVKHNPAPTPNRLSLYNPLVYVDSFEYWTINRVGGTAAAQIVMNWDNSKIPFPNLMVSEVRIANYDGTFWRSIGGSAAGNALTTGTATSLSVSAFNRNFTFGSLAYTLPVKIISFTAGRINDYTKLNWTVGNEQHMIRYELQRSDDGINYYTVYTHQPYNRNGTEFYSYEDKKYLSGTAFYRLKIVDLGTAVSYSQIVTVSANTTGREFYVITNPVNTSIELYAGNALKGLYNYTVTNTAGQLVQAGTLDIKNAGSYSIYLKPTITAGAYVLLVQNESNRLQKMIIKR
ncbi:MAG: hypothetical protein JNM14_05280 [Ferruginibacter sp.]|nr:hypothetical protein [Ferruginibacter sp.]